MSVRRRGRRWRRPSGVLVKDRLAGDLEVVAATTACSPAAWARRHAQERLGLDPDEIDGSHYISLSRPREFADRLAARAAETG